MSTTLTQPTADCRQQSSTREHSLAGPPEHNFAFVHHENVGHLMTRPHNDRFLEWGGGVFGWQGRGGWQDGEKGTGPQTPAVATDIQTAMNAWA